MTTITTHPDFPFVQIGKIHELSPDDGPDPVFSPFDWIIRVDDVIDGGDAIESSPYPTEELAKAGAEAWLFSPNRRWLIESHLQRAWKTGDFELAVKLAEARGRAQGYLKAQSELVTLRARIAAALN